MSHFSRPKLGMFQFFDQILVCFDFLGQISVCFDFLDQILVVSTLRSI